ncbi:MAG: dockerin type I repeat-containing protein, partial [Ruminococcus sp.]|nr:dockerin type I repeat-containing protein [Ruminococcus sp.]
YYYIRPAAMTGGYLATCSTDIYDPATGAVVASFSGTGFSRKFCGANAVVADGVAYVLATAHTVRAFELNSGELSGCYSTDKTVVSMTGGKNGVMLLTSEDAGYRYEAVPFGSFTPAEEQTVDLNTLPVYQRTKAEIVRRFAQAVPQDYSAPMFSETGSVTAPYKEYTITPETQASLVRTASYYRWLAGLSGFETADATTWSNAAKGAVLTERNCRLTGSLSHTPERPADMDEDFYQAGYRATSASNLSFGYGNGQRAIVKLLRGFLNDRGYHTPGHRDTFMTRNGVSFAAGYSEQGGVNTIIYQGDPNPQGASVTGNDLPAYAWPAPGHFPAEDIDTSAVWTINLNTDLAGTTDKEVCVTITDLQTGEQFVRDSEETGLYSTTSWGKYLSFLPPTATSYAGKRYRVEVTNLINAEMLPVKLSYTVSFFSYADGAELDGVICTADKYGRLTAVCDLGDVNGDGMVTVIDVTEIQRIVAELHVPDDRERLAADVDRNGIVSIADATRLQNYLAEYFDKL